MAQEQQVQSKVVQGAPQQTITQDVPSDGTQEVAAQEKPAGALQKSVAPTYPSWPHSKPGPRSTPPPPGMRSTHQFRTEQVTEVGYNQETGEPGVQSPLRSLPDAQTAEQASFDQQQTAQDALGKRKKRL